MTIKVYQYPRCSTCVKAIKFLDQRNITYRSIDITKQPPSKIELRKMLGYVNGEVKRLFNTSGQVYRELGLSTKLGSMKPQDAVDLLARNGKLVKRPFVLTETTGVIGFNEKQWEAALK
ncbi:MAG: arsenate reductase family protein [Gammaproteobacteria bacterium]|nr:arsenate reductase family protein [Gammaproteobacteria bacterium]